MFEAPFKSKLLVHHERMTVGKHGWQIPAGTENAQNAVFWLAGWNEIHNSVTIRSLEKQ